MITRSQITALVLLVLLFTSCATVKRTAQPTASIKSIKLLGQYIIPYATTFKNTAVGGLSGIDYDSKKDQYYLVSDDRSDRNPARFYTAKIFISAAGIDSLRFTGVEFMRQPDGTVYPNNKQDRTKTPDPESMRYDPANRLLVWSSEGERIVKAKDTVLVDPSINIINKNGKYYGSFEIPANLRMHANESGPRQNGVLEGLSFADDYKTLFVNVEEPLYQDGPKADTMENNAFIRIYRFDAKTKKSTAQYAYRLSPVAYPPNPSTGFKINGVPEILSLGNDQLLVIERSFSTGRLASNIKVFMVNLEGATDISDQNLKDNTSFRAVSKKLLLNMDDLGIYTDNIEGLTFGPALPNGHKTLLFVADNNFTIAQQAQLFLFEVEE